jgi:hypothetical protein
MDYGVVFICGVVFFGLAFEFWYNYLSRFNKISDEQLMDNYVTLVKLKRTK